MLLHLLCPAQIGTWTPKGSTRPSGSTGGPTVSYRRAWGISVQRDDDAYLWARWLAPVYSVTVANIKTALRLQVGLCSLAWAAQDSWCWAGREVGQPHRTQTVPGCPALQQQMPEPSFNPQ